VEREDFHRQFQKALEELEVIDPRAVQILKLRVYAGMTLELTAAVLGVARPTVVRAFRFGSAFLANKRIELLFPEGQ
jgi:AraC-like DNA-binding protein